MKNCPDLMHRLGEIPEEKRKALIDLFKRALEEDPDERMKTPGEFAVDLGEELMVGVLWYDEFHV